MPIHHVVLMSMLALTPVGAAAQQVPLNGSLDDLKNVCEFNATPKELRAINATAMLVQAQFLHPDLNGNYYYLPTEPYTQDLDWSGQPFNVCSGTFLYGEEKLAGASRTAFLIDSDYIDSDYGSEHVGLMMTAPHGLGAFDPTLYRVVFRNSKTDASDPTCINFNWDSIPASSIYRPTRIVSNPAELPPYAYDYQVFALDRAVPDRAPLKIRRSGTARVGDLLVVPSYGIHGSERIDGAAVMAGLPDLLYNIHGFDGSSGSPVYNVGDDVVESAVAKGTSFGWEDDVVGNCKYAVQSNPQITNAPVVDVQDDIPRAEVLVAPLDYIEHVLAIHGTDSGPPSSSYAVTTARTGQGGELIEVEKTLWPNGPNDPVVSLSIQPGFYNVPANGLSFAINSDASNVNSCGQWDYELNVHDITNDQNNIIRHHFEVGMREFSIDPDEDWVVHEISAPYGSTKTYTIENVRPTPTHVLVSPDGTLPNSNLILVNGGGTVAFDLGPHGSGTDTATVHLTLNQTAAAATSMGVEYHGRVAIYHQPFNCTAPPQNVFVYRNLTFTRGEQPFGSQQGPSQIPPPSSGQQYGNPVRFDLDLTGEDASTCVGDVNLYLGVPTTPVDTIAAKLKIQLTAPNGTSGVLWQGNSIPLISPYASTTLDVNGATSTPALYLDDQTAPPLGPSMLSLFNGKSLKGHWYVDVSSSNPTLLIAGPAQLDFTRRASCIGGGT